MRKAVLATLAAVAGAYFCAGCADGGSATEPLDALSGPPEACPAPDFARAGAYARQWEVVFDREENVQIDAVLMVPEGPGPFSGLVAYHSGAWFFGDWRLNDYAARHYAEAGMVVMNVNYRLVDDVTLPEQVRDAVCALRWLQARAADYGIAPGCIGLLGDSAGGQLAEMVALAGDEPRYLERCEEAAGETPAPRFVVSYYGAHDMAAVEAHVDPETRALLPMLVEEGDDFRAYSPIRYADRHPEVDFFLSHGTFDRLVPYESSIAFEAALRGAGHRTALNVIEGAGHGYLSWLFYLSPFREEAEPLADAFIQESLARGPRR